MISVDFPDPETPVGARGIGEPPVAAGACAILNALSDALGDLVGMDNTKKELLYDLALVCEKMSDKEGYLEALKEIYNNDYGFKDVAKRVESSYA